MFQLLNDLREQFQNLHLLCHSFLVLLFVVLTAPKFTHATEPCLQAEAEAEALRTSNDRSVKITQDRAYSLQEFTDGATPFLRGDEVPGGHGGLMQTNRWGRYLHSLELTDIKLGYPEGNSSLRFTYQPKPRLPNSFDALKKADVAFETKVYLVSKTQSGSAGLVRLAELSSGRKVVIKTYVRSFSKADVLVEARSAMLLDELGMGPKFHGIYKDKTGKWNIVMDVVPGDFEGVPATLKTLEDAETMIYRLKLAGINKTADFQFFITPDGRLMTLDPASLSKYYPSENISHLTPHTDIRVKTLVLVADVEHVGIPYLEKIRFRDFEAWKSLMDQMSRGESLKRKFGDYIKSHQFLLK